jgi:hypothetical protein
MWDLLDMVRGPGSGFPPRDISPLFTFALTGSEIGTARCVNGSAWCNARSLFASGARCRMRTDLFGRLFCCILFTTLD